MTKKKVACFLCGKKLKTEERENKDPSLIGIVYDGIIFRATGNYGSSVFDPMPDDGFLEIIICDECVTKEASKIKRVKNIRRYVTVEADIGEFDPGVR